MLKSRKNLSRIAGTPLRLSPFVLSVGLAISGSLSFGSLSFGSLSFGSSSAVAAELSEIRDRGYITIAIKDNRAPLSSLDESGNYSGYEIDIAHRLAKELLGDETAVQFVPTRNVERINAVIADEVDIAIAAITLTEPRRRIVDFSNPYYLDGTAFITRSPEIARLEDLRLGIIAVLNRSSSVPHVRFILPGARLVGVGSYAEGQALLATGEVDAFAGDASVLTGWLQDARTPSAEYRMLPNLLSADPLAIAIPKGVQHEELREQINAAIRRWYREGWLQERAEFWGLPSGINQFVNLSPTSDESR